MKRIAILLCALFLVSCDSNSDKLPTVTEQPTTPSLSEQIHAPLDKAKAVETMLQQGKDERDEAIKQQLSE